jgi:hypothetical protein
MTIMEAVQLGLSLGVFSGGLGLAKWGLNVERRLYKLELRTEPENGKG